MGFGIPCLFVLVLIGSTYGNIQSVDLQCKFETHDFATIGKQYTCVVQNDLNISESNVSIINLTGSHADDQSSNSVTAVIIQDKKVEYLPKNFGEIFENLAALKVKNGRLKELRKDDLMSVPKLKYLNLDNNDIEVLDDDVFEFNPQLELLWLNANKIKKISEKLADSFKKLVSLDLTKNICTDKKFAVLKTDHANLSKQQDVKKFYVLTEIIQKCSNFTDNIYEIETKIKEQDHPEVKIYKEQIEILNSQLFNTMSELRSIKLKLSEEMSAKNKTMEMLNELKNNQSSNDINASNIAELEIKLKIEEKEVRNLKDELKKLRSIHDDFSSIKSLIKHYEDERHDLKEKRELDQAQIRDLQAKNAQLTENCKKIITDREIDDFTPETTAKAEANLEQTTSSPSTKKPRTLPGFEDEYELNEIIEETTIYDYYN
ncbi:uncharacterized protein MCAP_0864-like [Chironomus tepperi]|uniref:uncharacterized protein MCAP_0864-like n=1 Tax=Chironomus tepperi TaxID=113505 RepID=UPI00391F6858